MKVSFDPDKDRANRLKHRLSLADFEGFDTIVAVEIDDRYDYGDVRYRGFGRIGGLGHAIIFTETLDGFRLISFRRAHEKEMRRYE